jgi:hypothetical protein
MYNEKNYEQCSVLLQKRITAPLFKFFLNFQLNLFLEFPTLISEFPILILEFPTLILKFQLLSWNFQLYCFRYP